MTSVENVIDQVVRAARDASRRDQVERATVKAAEELPRNEVARGLREMAIALRREETSS